MLFDQLPSQNLYSTQLFQHSSGRNDPQIEPWQSDQKTLKRLYTKKQSRTIEVKQKSRRQSVDERIQSMYNKYQKEHSFDENLSSREKYREKLVWLEKGQEFKQLGGNTAQILWEENQPEQKQKQKGNKTNVLCMGDQHIADSMDSPKKKHQYKCNQNFQRMLKIKEKLRKKHTLSNYKQKSSIRQQNQTVHPQTHRQLCNDFTAKATLQKNKLKLKMRGLSKQKLNNTTQELNKIQIIGVCSTTNEYTSLHDRLAMTTPSISFRRTQNSSKPVFPGFMNLVQRQLSR